jgi:predicted Zn-dependent protease
MFLINYGKYTRATKDTTRLMEIGNLLARSMTKPADLESQMGFYVIQRLIVDYKNPIAQYYFKNLANYKSKYKADDIKNAGEMVLFSTLYGKRTNQLSSAEVVQIRQEMIKLGTPADVAAGRTLLKELEAYFREKNTAKATARFDAFIKTNKVELLDYAYLVRLFNERATDNSYANSLIKWSNNALRLVKPGEQNSKEVAGLYYEQAQAYKRLNNKVEGKRAAEKALAVAKVSGENVGRYTALVASFK